MTDKEKEELQNLVLSASGANYERGDVITVSSLQFESIAEEKAKQAQLDKEIKTKSTVDYLTKDLGPLLVVLILGLAALFVIRGVISRFGQTFEKPEKPTYEPVLPPIEDNLDALISPDNMPKIEANIDPELERVKMEINDTIMADPAEAARLLVSFIKE